MKRTLFIIISVMPLITLADDPLPKRSDFNRYQAMLTRPPFAIATVAVPSATPDFAKDLFVAMEETGKDPAALVEERGLKQVTDSGAIEAAIKAVIDANPGQVAAYKAKPTLFGWFGFCNACESSA